MQNIISTFKLLWFEAKSFLVISVFFKVVQGFIPFFSLVITTTLVNNISLWLQKKNVSLDTVIFLIILQLILMLSPYMLNIIYEYLNLKAVVKMDYYTQSQIITKISQVPYGFFDIPEFYNHLNRVKTNDLGKKIMSPYLSLNEVLSGSISVVSTFIFLFKIHFGIAILGLLTAFPVLIIHSNFGKKSFNLMKKQIPKIRELDYLKTLLQTKSTIKEIRTFSLEEYIFEAWKSLFSSTNKEIIDLNKKNQYLKLYLQVFQVICYGIAYGIVIKLLKNGVLKIGNFVAIPQGFKNLQSGVTKISTNLANIRTTKFYIDDYFDFIKNYNLSNSNHENYTEFPNKLQKGIVFKNVSFSYGLDKKVLKDISFKIKPQEKIAIVGENGSGKTTLIKCLLGLYSVQEGEIFFDDVKIENIRNNVLRKNITALFQDYVKYQYSVHNNIAFGNIERINDKELIKKVAQMNGVDQFVRNFQKGYETRLGRMLGEGVELSGGQWHKIALSRALIRESQVVILDEPTAAFDPISEFNFYQNFSELTKDKTVIYISHRMSTAKLADTILLMKDGRIVESGSHNELIKNKKEYYELYQKQLHMYG